jgi:tRNA(Ile)-lysidine synthase
VNLRIAVEEFLKSHAVEGPVVVAVSGGPDSVALLSGLRLASSLPLIVAHANHQLRGAESDADEAFVRELAEQWKLPFRTTRLTIPTNENLESAARRLRYGWLSEVASAAGAKWIATGHTANDQAETVLHRLIRGTGLQGLRGIAVSRDTGNISKIIRPIIRVTRAELLDFLAEDNLLARTDSSNADSRFTRNRIRHELLPKLREYNPEIVAVLNRLAEHSGEAFDFIESHAQELLQRAERPRAGAMLIFEKAMLESASPFLVREMLRLLWQREGWPRDAMTAAHWQRAATFVVGDYPDGVRLNVTGKVVQLHRV